MISIPFHGSKKTSYKYVKPIVEKYGYTSVYEPFGGSGVLSVNLYKDGLVERAVINDYDRFFDDYEEYLDYKDWIVEECNNHGIQKVMNNKPLSIEDRIFLQSLVEQVPERLWRKLAGGCNFCFSTIPIREHVYLKDFKYFQRYLKTDKYREYYKWVSRLLDFCDYREFLNKYFPEMDKNSLLIIDPPYHSTYQTQYEGSFSEKDTKELIEQLKELKIDFILFHDNEEVVKGLLTDLDIVEYGDCTKGISTRHHSRKRTDYFALVQF